ncbi:asparagine synthetase [Petrotoga mexicana DSM 14811]|uniref:Asparagine synthetase n=1 Tax=Petrotoga mexicana DSM 14811 TaxID=1122954 RepID=A0A2K1P4Q0_9BACT|nr:asparagine synthetase A [Petrotoga mexicana]PNR97770.1 asparagine synthetase [Petrotoga mexicana DSM 14811]
MAEVEKKDRKVDSVELVKIYLEDETYSDALLVQSEILRLSREFLSEKGFVEILPVIVSTITDPLNHDVFDAQIDYYGNKYYVTKSMILQKQVSVLVHDKIFSFSPNLRLETAEKYSSGRHLIDFVQLDIEAKEMKREEIMDLMEDLIIYVLKGILTKYSGIIEKYHPNLRVPTKPFQKISVKKAKELYGDDYEKILSERAEGPVWLIDMPLLEREFYDKQDIDNPEVLLDFDLIYPEGHGEGISGGEREHEYEQIVKRIKLKGNGLESYEDYLKLAKEGLLKHSAGCGIGIERFTKYILDLDHVEKTRLFAKAPGKYTI